MDSSELARQMAALRPRVTVTCAQCGLAFETFVRKGARYCSQRCRQAAWIEKNREKERERVRAYRQRRQQGESK